MSKLFSIPAFLSERPRLFWGIVILGVFAWLLMSCGFAPFPVVAAPPTLEPALTPTVTPIPPAHQNPDFVLPTPTPLPQEWYSTPDQTTGIILGVSVLLLVILIGTLSTLRRMNKKR
jgi:hypothetical protein